ncbi:MAG: YfhO family protein [Lachnospiraceae bacterium]|nr:YfhO family protein [Lachnospiraceae bacterium]
MKNKKINISSLVNYGLAAIVPILILFGFRVFYTMGYGHIVPNTLLMPQIFFNGLASMSFFYYLKHSSKMEMIGTGFPLLFSLGYGLCSYGLLQESSISYLTIYALLPLLFLALERFIKEGKTLPLVLLLALCFCLDTMTGFILTIYLLISFFVEQGKEKGAAAADFIHLILLALFALLLSSLYSLPQLKAVMDMQGVFSYNYFDLTAPIANFFSRFLLGTVTWQGFPQLFGLHLYFGLFFLLCFVLFFFNTTFSKKKRIQNLIFTLFLLCTLELFPLQYLLELGVPEVITIFYAFFPIFWFLRTAAMSFTELLSLSKKRLCIGIIVWGLFIAFALSGSYLNFHPIALQSNILFMVLFILVVLGLFSKYFDKTASLLLPCLICLELFCNLFLSSNQNFIPDTLTLADHFPFQAVASQGGISETGNEDEMLQISSPTPYEAFRDEHNASHIYGTLNVLFDYVEFTEADALETDEYGLVNLFEQANILCRKIGGEDNLFTPIDCTIVPVQSEAYRITDQGNHVFNLYQYPLDETAETTETAYELSCDHDCTTLIYNDCTNEIFSLDLKAGESYTIYFKFGYSQDISINYRLLAYEMNDALFNGLPDLIAAYELQQQAAGSSMSVYYLGIGLTCLGVFLLLLFYLNSDGKKLYAPLLKIKRQVSESSVFEKCSGHFRHNYVYWLAAFIPIILFLLTMVVYSCIPFGINSFYDQDGLLLTLPSILDWYYNLKSGHLLYSLNGGYGYSLYANNPLGLLYFPLTLLKPEQIGGALLLGEAICIGLSSLSLVYYLTHRLSGKKADKRDYRLLVPGFIYALNTYMLAMHGFTTWYMCFLALPLLILAFERLIYQKRCGLYILLLAFVIYSNLYLALYMCIFLALTFFTCHFADFVDFVKKGIRFGVCSLLGAGSSFFVILNTPLSTYDSQYRGNDSIFPSPGLHTSFLEQWKQFMIFSKSTAVDHNDGGVSLFMGILTLVLVLLYLTSKKYQLKERLKKLVLLAILFASFNGQILSYLWNGFHYQSNVPNRYVFLLMFLCAVMAYDGLRALNKVTWKKWLTVFACLAVFFCICQFGGEGNETVAFYTTLGLVLFYMVLCFIRSRLSKPIFIRLMTLMVTLELAVNMLYFTSTYTMDAIHSIDNFEEQEVFFAEKLKSENAPLRISIPASYVINSGLFYNVSSASLFNSFVTRHQTNLAMYHGFLCATNFINTNYNGTPLSHALAGNQYILLPRYASTTLPDLKYYEYVGCMGDSYLYKIPYTLSLGFYAPYELMDITENANFVPYFLNDFTALYTKKDAESLFTVQSLQHSEVPDNIPNSFRFLDETFSDTTYELAFASILDNAGNISTIRDLYLDLHFDPADEGFVYLYLGEFVPIGESNDPFSMRTTITYPSAYAILDDFYNYAIFHPDVFEEFYETASKQQMANIAFEGNCIKGTTDYTEDGYTVLALPYERGFKAYVDGEEVEILDPYEAFMVIETPKGKHTIELVYEPYGMKTGLVITVISIILSVLFCLVLQRRQQYPVPEIQQTK